MGVYMRVDTDSELRLLFCADGWDFEARGLGEDGGG